MENDVDFLIGAKWLDYGRMDSLISMLFDFGYGSESLSVKGGYDE